MLRIGIILSGLLFIATAIGVYLGDLANPTNWDLKWHAGKPRGQWVKLLYEGTPEERNEAADAMVAFGSAIMPEMVQALRDGDGPTRELVMSVFVRIGEPALDPLRAAYSNPQLSIHRSRYQMALTRLGAQWAPQVAAWLDLPNIAEQRLALAVLPEWHIGPELIVPRCDRLLANEDLAEDVVKLLSTIGKEVLQPLVRLAGHSRPDVRTAALVALGNLGPDAVEAVAALQERLENCDNQERDLIEKTIQLIQPPAKP